MRRPLSLRILTASLALGLVLGAVLLGVGLETHHSHPRRPVAASDPRAAEQSFAIAYARFLSGEGAAAALPDATAAVQRLVARAGRAPAHAGAGSARLTGALRIDPQTWTLALADGGFTVHANVTVARARGGWRISGLVPPDFESELQRPTPGAGVLPAAGVAPARAARAFLTAYLAFEYGQASLGAIPDMTGRLRRFLADNTPRLAVALRPRIVALVMRRSGSSWLAEPSVTDGQQTYEVVVRLARVGERWVVTGIPVADGNGRTAP